MNPAPVVAIASGSGRSAIGIIRISGPGAFAIAERICFQSGKPFQITAGRVRQAHVVSIMETRSGKLLTLDAGLCLPFQGPASFTGFDTVELFLHGNPLILSHTLALCVQAGCRPASPGEFTLQALRNNKMDLVQAEAIRCIIEARSRAEIFASQRLRSGELSRRVSKLRSRLIGLKAELEAEIDFSSEDLTFQTAEAQSVAIRSIIAEIKALVDRAGKTRQRLSRWQIALAGVPNAGKSSLLNALLGRERALVSSVAGTTRDFISEDLELAGIPVRLVDTAGLRETEDTLEKAGVRLARKEIEQSQIVLHVLDVSLDVSIEQTLGAGSEKARVLSILNKSDICHPSQKGKDGIAVSCQSGAGIPELLNKIEEIVKEQEEPDPDLLEERHIFHFNQIVDALEKSLQLKETMHAPPEIVALELDRALSEAGAITGVVLSEEILGRIFSTFCVGK